MADPSTRLVLIRHGESRAAIDQVVGGVRGCTGLSALGVQQCLALRDRLAVTGELDPVDRLLASVLPRAIETAELIAPALGLTADDVVQDPDVCELDPGECDGMAWDDFRRIYGEVDMRTNPDVPLSPGGESLTDFHFRVGRALRRLVEDNQGRTLVVATHGGFITGSLDVWLGLPIAARRSVLNPTNASITEWSGPPDGPWQLDRYNDTAHLGSLRFSE